MQRDFLTASPAAVGSDPAYLRQLMAEQRDFLSDIAMYLRRQDASVLCSAVVKHTSQLSNSITDLNCHEVTFQVGGKPVSIYKLLAFSTYNTGAVAIEAHLSILSMANVLDGITLTAARDPIILPITLNSVYVQLSALADSNACPINGPASVTYGGLFLYGFTTSDYDYAKDRQL